MKTVTKVALWVLVPLATLFLYAHFVHRFQRRYIPPSGITTVGELLEWTGRPWWVVRYSSPTATYYEIGKKVPDRALVLTLASGAPSYTVDATGRFIGWSPDSGDVHTPYVLRSRDLTRESIDVDEFIRKTKAMTPNQALEATSEPAPRAGSSAPQG
jgi:hypothetical protein